MEKLCCQQCSEYKQCCSREQRMMSRVYIDGLLWQNGYDWSVTDKKKMLTTAGGLGLLHPAPTYMMLHFLLANLKIRLNTKQTTTTVTGLCVCKEFRSRHGVL